MREKISLIKTNVMSDKASADTVPLLVLNCVHWDANHVSSLTQAQLT